MTERTSLQANYVAVATGTPSLTGSHVHHLDIPKGRLAAWLPGAWYDPSCTSSMLRHVWRNNRGSPPHCDEIGKYISNLLIKSSMCSLLPAEACLLIYEYEVSCRYILNYWTITPNLPGHTDNFKLISVPLLTRYLKQIPKLPLKSGVTFSFHRTLTVIWPSKNKCG